MKNMSTYSFRFLPVSAVFVMASLAACDRTANAPTAVQDAPATALSQPASSSEDATDSPDKNAASTEKERSLDDVLAELSAKWETIHSLSAEVNMVAHDKNEAQNLRYGGIGAYACIKKNGKLTIRRDMVNTILPGVGPATRERTSTIISDDEFTYILTEEDGKKSAQKMETDKNEIVRVGGRALFDQLKSIYELELKPNLVVEGREVYIITGRPREGTGRHAFGFDREWGVMVQWRIENESGLSSRTITFSHIRLNPEFDESHFEFQLPDGVQMFDMTKIGKSE